MKKILIFVISLLLCGATVACDEVIGQENTTTETAEQISVTETEPTYTSVLVDWMDFVRVGGIVYDGGWENREVDESRIGEKLGEILYTVKSYYESEEELQQADKRDFTAAFRPIGSEIFALKDDENSIAVLDNGKYYLYTHRTDNSISFEVFGADDGYNLPSYGDEDVGFTINELDELGERFGGCEDPTPEFLVEKYGSEKLKEITLIVVRLVSGRGGVDFGIKSVSEAGGDILVNAVRFESDADGDSAMHYWTFFIEIPKTDHKDVIVQVDECDPLKNDSELRAVTYEQINSHILYTPDEGIEIYGGKPVTDKFAAEEIARSLGNYADYGWDVRYCPTNNYWLVELTRSDGGNTSIIYAVIRAADGKVISRIEVMS